MSEFQLPARPSAEHLRKQAKDRVHAARSQGAALPLHEAQWALAREYGFASWNRLMSHVQGDAPSNNLKRAVEAIQRGEIVILFDDEGRENEGDFVLAAQYATPEAINFMVRYGRGTLCLAMDAETIARLGLQLMKERTDLNEPSFCLSIDAATGITTGVSATDRARTIQAAIADRSGPHSIRTPGHIFPLRAEPGGPAVRAGHTEGSVELMKRAGLKPGAVIIEILNEDGSMARLADLSTVAKAHGLPLVRMSDLM